MMAKRVIPCLDVHDGKVTRGVQFGKAEAGELRNVGDPVELALRYNEQGADEMVFFDITATAHGRATMVDVHPARRRPVLHARSPSAAASSPWMTCLRCFARARTKSASLLRACQSRFDSRRREKFGSQCIVVSIDAKKIAPDKWGVFSHGARKNTGLDAVEWAKHAVSLGAGEIVLNSIDADA